MNVKRVVMSKTAPRAAPSPAAWMLERSWAAVIGGTSLFGGRGNVWSALFGPLVIGITIDALSRRTREAVER
jgi:ribose/xylose/arabinose/galactoside ABC-type transport system permease subunit